MKHVFKTQSVAIYLLALLHCAPTHSIEHKIPKSYTNHHLRVSEERFLSLRARHYRPHSLTFVEGPKHKRNAPFLQRLVKNQWTRTRHLSLLGNSGLSKKFEKIFNTSSFASRLKVCNVPCWRNFAPFKRLEHAVLNISDQHESKATSLYYKAFKLRELRHLITLSFTPDTNSALCLPLIYYLKHLPHLKHLTLDLRHAKKDSLNTLEHSRLLKCFLWIQQTPVETLKIKLPVFQELSWALPPEKLGELLTQLKKIYFSIGWEESSRSLTTITREDGTLDSHNLDSFFDKISTPLCASLFEVFQAQEKLSKFTLDSMHLIVSPLAQGSLSKNLVDFFKSLTRLTITRLGMGAHDEQREIAIKFKVLFTHIFPHLEKLKTLELPDTPSVTDLKEDMNNFDEFKTAITETNFASLEYFQGPIIKNLAEHLFANPTFTPSHLVLGEIAIDRKLLGADAGVVFKHNLEKIIVDILRDKKYKNLNTLEVQYMSWENFEPFILSTDCKIKNLVLESSLTEQGLNSLTLCKNPLDKLQVTLNLETNPLLSLETVLRAFEKAPWAKTLKALTIQFKEEKWDFRPRLNKSSFPSLEILSLNYENYFLRDNLSIVDKNFKWD